MKQANQFTCKLAIENQKIYKQMGIAFLSVCEIHLFIENYFDCFPPQQAPSNDVHDIDFVCDMTKQFFK